MRIIDLLSDAISEERSREEVYEIFLEAGIISNDGELETPYEESPIPVAYSICIPLAQTSFLDFTVVKNLKGKGESLILSMCVPVLNLMIG